MLPSMAFISSWKMSPQIPDEVLAFEILIRLPVRSLIQFKCVCKSWYALMQNPNFITAHCLFHKINNSRLLLNNALGEEDYVLSFLSDKTLELESNLDLPFPAEIHLITNTIRILGSASVNGIICTLQNRWRLFLWNPSTRQVKLLPPSKSLVPTTEYRPKFIGFGFGYDRVLGDYKVVRIIRLSSYTAPLWFFDLAEVYSLRNDCWRKLDASINWNVKDFSGEFLLNGVFHWIAQDKSHELLLSFDMSTELFSTTDVPFLDGSNQITWIFCFKESVAIIISPTTSYSLDMQHRYLEVWSLGEVGAKDSWTKLFIIGPLLGLELPIGVGKGDEIFFVRHDSTFFRVFRAEVVSFNHNTLMFRNHEFRVHPTASRVVTYSESLVSLL